MVIGSVNDVLWIDVELNGKPSAEVDIDNKFNLTDIKAILYHSSKFYVLANKYNSILGYYLLELEVDLNKNSFKHKWVIKWNGKLNIDDVSLSILVVNNDG